MCQRTHSGGNSTVRNRSDPRASPAHSHCRPRSRATRPPLRHAACPDSDRLSAAPTDGGVIERDAIRLGPSLPFRQAREHTRAITTHPVGSRIMLAQRGSHINGCHTWVAAHVVRGVFVAAGGSMGATPIVVYLCCNAMVTGITLAVDTEQPVSRS